ncbi:MAG: histidine--tRNA ligase [Deltaproteobacteria bacterium]|nr:histidine--tRNA ligase [Deltaproteobacteria bacterium]
MELLPGKQIAFQRMLDTIRRGFERFGFWPIETPVFELTDVLLTKTGGETEKQVYFVESTGSLQKRADAKERDGKADARPEHALRFDLTVPLARYVAQHENELTFPFRRYQIQRVYRGERNQAGRYREFYQCDIDVVGKDTLSLAYDAEVPAIIHGIFTELAFGAFAIRINNRRLLKGLLETLGITPELHAAVLHEVDRLGKQSREDVAKRLVTAGLGEPERLLDVLTAHRGDSQGALAALHAIPSPTPSLATGIEELQRVYEGTLALGVPASGCVIDLSIVRGLDYYTGTVYETFLTEHADLGSICSGGRYDNLAEHYTKSRLPGVGISIGATRLFYQLERLGLVGDATTAVAQVMVLSLDPQLAGRYARLATELRGAGVNVEVYGAGDKFAKQLKYADKSRVPLALILGQQEDSRGIVKLKDLRDPSGANEHEVAPDQLVARVQELLARRPQPKLDPA